MKTKEKFIDMAINLYENGQNEKAFDCITEALEIYPTGGELWYLKGNLLHNFESYEEAIECYEIAEEYGFNLVNILNNKAHCYLNLDENKKAIECYDRAININPNEAETWYNKGCTLGAMHSFEEANNCFNKAVELAPDNPEYQEFQELALQELKKINIPEGLEPSLSSEEECMEQGNEFLYEKLYKNANVCFTKAVEFNPKNNEAWGLKGLALMQLNLLDEAVNAFDKSLSLKRNADYLNYKGQVLYELGKKEEAINCMSESVSIDPGDEYNWLFFGRILDEEREYDKAINCYKNVTRLNDQNVKAWRSIGDILLHKLNSYKEAVYYYDKVLEINPNDDDTLLMKGNALSYIGQEEEAIKCYDKVLEINPNNEYAAENKGTSYLKLGKRKEAMASYKEAAKNNPHIDILFHYGSMSFLESEYEEAIEYFDEELKRYPSDKSLLSMKGWALVKLARYEEAMQCYIKCKYNVLNIFVSLITGDVQKNIDERRQLLPYIDAALKNDDFFMSIAEQIKDNIKSYKSIYIRAMEIISLLYVDLNYEGLVATYTKETVAEKLLLEKSPLWLSLITKSNDPKEGQTLLDYFYNGNAPEKGENIEKDFGVFAACFTFNHDNPFHFERYGKSEAGIKNGGVSIVVNEHLFKMIDIQYIVSSIVEKNRTRRGFAFDKFNKHIKDNEDLKLPLFRCIYVDPATGIAASLGQREEYTFYQPKEDAQAYGLYQNMIQNILNEVRRQLGELKKEIKNLDPEIVSQLLLPLRYLVKDKFFEKEQECRIYIVKALNDEKMKINAETGEKHFDYLKTNDYVNKVILGAECRLRNDENFKKKYGNNGEKNIEHSKCQSNKN